MDEVTQQNTALVEEAAAASTAMGEEANQLKRLVSFFSMNADDVRKVAASENASAPERRSADRPWAATTEDEAVVSDSMSSAESSQQESPAVQMAATGTDDWEEF